MRRALVLLLLTVATVLALPPLEVNAVCDPPPPVDSPEGIATMRATQFIAWGTIRPTVPADAHGTHSFVLAVRGYFRGTGPAVLSITDYGDGDPSPDARRAGSAISPTRTFLDRFGGQDAVVFARRDDVPFATQLATTICTYTAYGDAEAADILPILTTEFGAAQPPVLATSGPAGVLGLSIAALGLLAAGWALRRATG